MQMRNSHQHQRCASVLHRRRIEQMVNLNLFLLIYLASLYHSITETYNAILGALQTNKLVCRGVMFDDDTIEI